MIGVYKIVHITSGKFYVGSSKDIHTRFTKHKNQLRKNKHHCIYLQRSYNKYGLEAFSFEIIIICSTKEKAIELEQQYLDSEIYLFNVSKCATGGDLLSYHPNRDEIIEKIRKTTQKNMNNLTPEERKQKFGSKGEKNGMYGKTHTKEVREKLSRIHLGNSHAKGCKRTPEHRKKLSELASQRIGEKNPFYGKHHTEETKRKISEANKGRKPPNCKSVKIDNKIYPSINEASRSLNIPPSTISYRVRNKKCTNYIPYDYRKV